MKEKEFIKIREFLIKLTKMIMLTLPSEFKNDLDKTIVLKKIYNDRFILTEKSFGLGAFYEFNEFYKNVSQKQILTNSEHLLEHLYENNILRGRIYEN